VRAMNSGLTIALSIGSSTAGEKLHSFFDEVASGAAGSGLLSSAGRFERRLLLSLRYAKADLRKKLMRPGLVC